MSWLGGPLPGTGEKIGLDPVPKFDPDYGDFYDGGGWTETIICLLYTSDAADE